MKYKILTAILAVGGLGYLLYKKINEPKEVLSIKKLNDENDYVIYFDENEVSIEEKFV